MKFANVSKGLLLGLALLLATSAFAAANKGSMQLVDQVTVSGKQLPAGDYSVKWDGSGPNVELSILKGNKVVATTPARLIDLSQKTNSDAAVVQENGDGSKALTEIHFSGRSSRWRLATSPPVWTAAAAASKVADLCVRRGELQGSPFFLAITNRTGARSELLGGSQHIIVIVDQRAARFFLYAFQRNLLLQRRVSD